jgi:hypothetical protein
MIDMGSISIPGRLAADSFSAVAICNVANATCFYAWGPAQGQRNAISESLKSLRRPAVTKD